MSIDATRISDTAFSVATDRTGKFVPGLRVRADCGADGLRLGTVEAAVYDATTGLTTVTLTPDGDGLTANLSGVTHGYATPDTMPRATDVRCGGVRLATPGEAAAGSDQATAVTPSGVSAAIDALVASGRLARLADGRVPAGQLPIYCGTDDPVPGDYPVGAVYIKISG